MSRTMLAFSRPSRSPRARSRSAGPPATLAKVTVSERRRQAHPEQDGDQRRPGARHRRRVRRVAEGAARERDDLIVVTDPNGNVIDMHQMDGVLPIGNETALMKAKTALYARSSSAVVAQRFNNVEGRVPRLDLGKASGAGVLLRRRPADRR